MYESCYKLANKFNLGLVIKLYENFMCVCFDAIIFINLSFNVLKQSNM